MYNENAVMFYNGYRYILPVTDGIITTYSEMLPNGSECLNTNRLPFKNIPDIIKIKGNTLMSVATIFRASDSVVLGFDADSTGDKTSQKYFYIAQKGIVSIFSGSGIINTPSGKEISAIDFVKEYIESIENDRDLITNKYKFSKKYKGYDFNDTSIITAFNGRKKATIIAEGFRQFTIEYSNINEFFHIYGDTLLIGMDIKNHCDLGFWSQTTEKAVEFTRNYFTTIQGMYDVLKNGGIGKGYVNPIEGGVHTLVLFDTGIIKIDNRFV